MSLQQLNERDRLSLHACNPSFHARGISIDSRAYVISLQAPWPIRTPERSSHLSGERRIQSTQLRGVTSKYRSEGRIFPPLSLSLAIEPFLIWGDRDMTWSFS